MKLMSRRTIVDEGHPTFEQLHAEVFPVEKIAAEADLITRRAQRKRENEKDEVGDTIV